MKKFFQSLAVVFLLAGIGWFGYREITRRHDLAIKQALQAERETYSRETEGLKVERKQLEDELAACRANNLQPGKADLAEAFGAEEPLVPIGMNAMDCRQVTAQVVALFAYLDRREGLFGSPAARSSEVFFEELYRDLNAAPPINVGELDNLFRLTANLTHFFRVLGKERCFLIRNILIREAALVEPAMAVLFSWQTTCSSGLNQTNLKMMYPYACFLLNTLGGRGYMLRRDGKTRTLLHYYAVLVIDKANDLNLNSNGLDIRPHLDYLLSDITQLKGLMYHRLYLDQVTLMKGKYPMETTIHGSAFQGARRG
ncbi:MAG: hypothetical protein ACOZF0_10045 [Thermodesulfobacteriota bacterium]